MDDFTFDDPFNDDSDSDDESLSNKNAKKPIDPFAQVHSACLCSCTSNSLPFSQQLPLTMATTILSILLEEMLSLQHLSLQTTSIQQQQKQQQQQLQLLHLIHSAVIPLHHPAVALLQLRACLLIPLAPHLCVSIFSLVD